ncbi:uncharacterized protein HMPREF1541_06439 [Cyphellophora europaea CBS 101466]|uniref:Uncharacterized protein n=1 Tax=Cyphellophora europaea (strain CBS 101466) TaxID=1220924 RepID=W2RRS7_CYPE1|nr:uncharacterized protein HMPREF1541_06439 [Cyphellophora europaea CBS 101466]ETN38404.1 hypothetical protein HMPREF1541_06439 [Cyphellophora europaea CBS 101466]
MNKSIIERIFPHSPSNVLPQYEDESPRRASSSSSSNHISLRDSTTTSPVSPAYAGRSVLQTAPLSASVVHHDDPFLPVERAAKSLERALQSLIDAQSDALEATIPEEPRDDGSSFGSPTPTPSLTPTHKHELGPKTMPIRQPRPKKPSLRSARRGLTKTMQEFARLKGEELRIAAAEAHSREQALQKSKGYEEKRKSLDVAMQAAQGEEPTAGAAALRSEASKVEQEIHELEAHLFELRTRHRHLTAQAEQYENTVESNLSSYRHSLSTIERDVRQFLRHPPVPCSLSNYDETRSTRGGMYALKADRRTLDMAQEQWTAEQALLERRRTNAEREQQALQQGAELWRAATERINAFEKGLRQRVQAGDPATGDHLTQSLDELMASLKTDIAVAEEKNWRLLMVCLGAELAALRRARTILTGEELPEPPAQLPPQTSVEEQTDDESGDPPQDLLNGGGSHHFRSPSVGSNQSLQDTLRQFNDTTDEGKEHARKPAIAGAGAAENKLAHPGDSDDDDPGPDFLVSRT